MAKIGRYDLGGGYVLLHTRYQWSGYSTACSDECLALVRGGSKVQWRLRLRLLPSERRWAWHTMEERVPHSPPCAPLRTRTVEAAAHAIRLM